MTLQLAVLIAFSYKLPVNVSLKTASCLTSGFVKINSRQRRKQTCSTFKILDTLITWYNARVFFLTLLRDEILVRSPVQTVFRPNIVKNLCSYWCCYLSRETREKEENRVNVSLKIWTFPRQSYKNRLQLFDNK